MFGQCLYVPIANCKRHVRVHSSHPTADKHALAPDTPHPLVPSTTCFIALCSMRCILFSLLRLVYIINNNSNYNNNNHIGLSFICASAKLDIHVYFCCLWKSCSINYYLPLYKNVRCHWNSTARSEQKSVSVCMYVCDSSRCSWVWEQKNERAEERVSASKRTADGEG